MAIKRSNGNLSVDPAQIMMVETGHNVIDRYLDALVQPSKRQVTNIKGGRKIMDLEQRSSSLYFMKTTKETKHEYDGFRCFDSNAIYVGYIVDSQFRSRDQTRHARSHAL